MANKYCVTYIYDGVDKFGCALHFTSDQTWNMPVCIFKPSMRLLFHFLNSLSLSLFSWFCFVAVYTDTNRWGKCEIRLLNGINFETERIRKRSMKPDRSKNKHRKWFVSSLPFMVATWLSWSHVDEVTNENSTQKHVLICFYLVTTTTTTTIPKTKTTSTNDNNNNVMLSTCTHTQL